MTTSNQQLPDFSQLIKQMKVPGVDVEALAASHQKDIEALMAANQRAYEGVQALVQQQATMLQEALQQAQAGLRSTASSQSLSDAGTKQAEVAKQAFEQGLANMRELAEMATNSQKQAVDAIQKRMQEKFEETSRLMKQTKA